LQKQLLEPTTVKKACWQLEAIGEKAAPMLAEVLSHPNAEIRFYAAHALAYLNDRRAIVPLTELAEQYPAFRAMSLNGLTILDHYEAADALSSLLNSSDPETRYGAVRALRRKDSADAQVSGRAVGETGRILEIPTSGPPLVVVSLTQTPEVVIFGDNPLLKLPAFEYVTPKLMINTGSDGRLTISHFEAGEEDRQVQVDSDLLSLLEGIAEVGGTYGNWVSFVREASSKGYLSTPLAMNPIPQAGRAFDRSQEPAFEPGENFVENTVGATPPQPAVWYNPATWMN
ncbi:MAG: HEAT repeat domain-containing protein, partial [Aureliella sp.]